VDASGRMSVSEVYKAMTKNTILIYASAPSYPHGTIDPIEELAKIALNWKCCLHVDACLGGFVLPFAKSLKSTKIPSFDFQVQGVTSLSVDTHKYGCAQKGSSIVLYHSNSLRKYQYTSVTEWSGGLYITIPARFTFRRTYCSNLGSLII
jgi:sphinganine-1-phosphate aldolase